MTAPRIENLAERYASGESLARIANDVGVSTGTVMRQLERLAIPRRNYWAWPAKSDRHARKPRKPKATRSLDAGMVECYRNGSSLRHIAGLAGVSHEGARQMLRRLGVDVRPRGSYQAHNDPRLQP